MTECDCKFGYTCDSCKERENQIAEKKTDGILSRGTGIVVNLEDWR